MTERLFILEPTVVFRARVNLASATYPISSIPYDGVTLGSSLIIRPGMTLLLGSTQDGEDYGRQRVRSANVSAIQVGRSSQGYNDGELNVADNAYITVLDDHRIWPKISYANPDGEIFKDGDIAPIGFTESPPPIANGGTGYAGTSGTVQFSASDSLQFDVTVTATKLSKPANYSWNVKDGTITVGSSTSENITVTFPPGFRWVELTVTSNTTMKEMTRYIPVFVRNPAADVSITSFHVTSQLQSAAGQTMTVEIFEDLPIGTFREGTLVMFWDDDLETSSPARTHMRFIGWMTMEDSNLGSSQNYTNRGQVFQAVDVAGRLKSIPGFSQELVYDATPVTWGETQFPRMFYYIWYLLYWHSTALEVADLIPTSATIATFAFLRRSSDEATIWEQVAEIARTVIPDHHITCNWRGQLQIVRDPMIVNVADRGSIATEQVISDNEWISVNFSRNRSPRVYQILAWAVLNTSAEYSPLRSKAPGDAFGMGSQYIETSEHITNSQNDLNNATGNRYARVNAPYEKFSIVVPYELLDPDVDPANMKRLKLEISADNATLRGIYFPGGVNGLVHEISITREYTDTGLIRTATLSWEKETSGLPGIIVQEY